MPLTSNVRKFFRPGHMLLASSVPTAPPANSTTASIASSTSTVPSPPCGRGRRSTKIRAAALTALISPTRKRARSMAWAARSPMTPLPACARLCRQVYGTSGSIIESSQYRARKCRICPSLPSTIISLASSTAGTNR